MAQTQILCTQGFTEMGKLMAGEAATALKAVFCMEGTCTVSAASTFANPGTAATKIAGNGLNQADADTVVSSTTTVTDDTAELDHVFTASGTETVTGFGVTNDDDDVLYGEVCLNAGVAMESSDTLTVEFKIQFKAD